MIVFTKGVRDLTENEDGFTLIELLVVITILGILAAIVVFSVGGINNRGQQAGCSTDTTTLETAEEAYFAQHGVYTDGPGLKNANLLTRDSTLHSVAPNPPSYTIKVLDAACATGAGKVGSIVYPGQTPVLGY